MDAAAHRPPLINPHAALEVIELGGGRRCLVLDDALTEPERWLEYSAERRDAFASLKDSYYPGDGLPAPAELAVGLTDCVMRHSRPAFGVRRCLSALLRYSMVTLPPAALRPRQWFCHRDGSFLDNRHRMIASVLYLFRDPALGGTGFYAPNRSPEEIDALRRASDTLPAEQFAREYGIEPGYQIASNSYFRRVGGVAARWNRLVCYDGRLLHSGDITSPDSLTADPRTGRLTVNGFFTCQRNLA